MSEFIVPDVRIKLPSDDGEVSCQIAVSKVKYDEQRDYCLGCTSIQSIDVHMCIDALESGREPHFPVLGPISLSMAVWPNSIRDNDSPHFISRARSLVKFGMYIYLHIDAIVDSSARIVRIPA
jgi:hypothetical protein